MVASIGAEFDEINWFGIDREEADYRSSLS
jgi:hypothetical protein